MILFIVSLLIVCFSWKFTQTFYMYFAARFCERKSASRVINNINILKRVRALYRGDKGVPTHKCTHIDTCMVCVLRSRKICAAISRCVCCFRIKMKYICVTVNIISHCISVSTLRLLFFLTSI